MKKMKIGSLLLLLVLLGCQHKKKQTYDQQPTVAVSDSNPYSSLLIGEWSQCYSRSKDGRGIMMNVCPTWIFDPSGSLWTSPKTEYQKWYVHGDTLYLSSWYPADKNSSKSTIEKFLITKSEDKNLIKLDLTHIERGYMERLVRVQPYLHLYLPVISRIQKT